MAAVSQTMRAPKARVLCLVGVRITGMKLVIWMALAALPALDQTPPIDETMARVAANRAKFRPLRNAIENRSPPWNPASQPPPPGPTSAKLASFVRIVCLGSRAGESR